MLAVRPMTNISNACRVCRRRVWSRLKRADDAVDDDLSKRIDIQSDRGSVDGQAGSSDAAVGHDGPQEAATPRDETRTSSAT